ncbi:N-alpha-acetyltransferase 38-A, NatC auxiliary subunit-like [Drosophila busckii]|uniref:N-alpha-acetyltransferase 38-A, NatC auxiliary subunit-like n=1 Tax=Drosophila busckii TaxID=30019 RepID=UPI00143294FC|nr:N-alpha-acetyltransferase 38-A, NatC auxiliary subunit-like [Drosophila busckii]
MLRQQQQQQQQQAACNKKWQTQQGSKHTQHEQLIFHINDINTATLASTAKSGEQSPTAGRQELKKWLGRLMRITLKNKLTLIGVFSCTDRDKNLILANCDTFHPDRELPIDNGNIVVPGDQILSVAIDMPETVVEQEPMELDEEQVVPMEVD